MRTQRPRCESVGPDTGLLCPAAGADAGALAGAGRAGRGCAGLSENLAGAGESAGLGARRRGRGPGELFLNPSLSCPRKRASNLSRLLAPITKLDSRLRGNDKGERRPTSFF